MNALRKREKSNSFPKEGGAALADNPSAQEDFVRLTPRTDRMSADDPYLPKGNATGENQGEVSGDEGREPHSKAPIMNPQGAASNGKAGVLGQGPVQGQGQGQSQGQETPLVS